MTFCSHLWEQIGAGAFSVYGVPIKLLLSISHLTSSHISPSNGGNVIYKIYITERRGMKGIIFMMDSHNLIYALYAQFFVESSL